MSQYITPLKENVQPTQITRKGQTLPREGDWVCLHCNNLNFSFRKKCNRCKVQTKLDNQRLSEYYYNSIPQPYYFQEKENFPSLYSQPQTYQSDHFTPSPKHQPNSDFREELSPQRSIDKLPSVSPLVKKYNHTTGRSTQESKRGGLFQNESMWANIDMSYLQQSRPGPFEDDDLDQIEKIIERIML